MIKVLHLRRRLISDKSSVRWKEYGQTSTGVDGDCDDGGGGDGGGGYLRRLNNYEKIHHNFYTQWANEHMELVWKWFSKYFTAEVFG